MPMQMQDLQDLFVMKLNDIYDAEQQGLQAMQQLSQRVQSPELKQGFQQHIEQSQQQVSRLEQIFQQMGQQPNGEKNLGIQGLIQESQKLLSQDASPEVLEAGIIACQQAMEHYEMAAYGTARTYAQLLNNDQAVQLLEQTLDEEKQNDEKLTQVAEKINVQAMQG
ncbi:ferritin-like domain-containing protein [Deinococcus pimensis]|uniref:ferritin-like domain-containing protein n=1 Tax=Deinococcus pimensis TaxID=309888 RepID=UPI0004AE55B0|nr:ferritin-like domain-containing protein [Deinococcus pimensis]